MSQWRDERRANGAVHSIEHIESLSDTRNRLLCVSDRTLYLLQNVVQQDVQFLARYAIEFAGHLYRAPTPGDESSELVLLVANQAELEIQDMSCELADILTEKLDAIAQAILAINQGSDLMQAVCCPEDNPLLASGYYDEEGELNPPEGEYDQFCCRARTWAHNYIEAAIELQAKKRQVGELALGLMSFLLVKLSIGVGAILALGIALIDVILDEDENTFTSVLEDAYEDLACAVYTSDTSTEAKAKVLAVISDLPDLNARTKNNMLANMVSFAALNKVFNNMSDCMPSLGFDCSGCGWECDVSDWEHGSGDLTPDGSQRTLTGVRVDDGDWYIQFQLGENMVLTLKDSTGWVNIADFNDYRYKTWSEECVLSSISGYPTLTEMLDVEQTGGWFCFTSDRSASSFQIEVTIETQ